MPLINERRVDPRLVGYSFVTTINFVCSHITSTHIVANTRRRYVVKALRSHYAVRSTTRLVEHRSPERDTPHAPFARTRDVGGGGWRDQDDGTCAGISADPGDLSGAPSRQNWRSLKIIQALRIWPTVNSYCMQSTKYSPRCHVSAVLEHVAGVVRWTLGHHFVLDARRGWGCGLRWTVSSRNSGVSEHLRMPTPSMTSAWQFAVVGPSRRSWKKWTAAERGGW
jgi:hypothetical protein